MVLAMKADDESDLAAKLAGLVHDGDRILVATGSGEPTALIEAFLSSAVRERKKLEIVQVMAGSRQRLLAATSFGHRVLLPVPGGPVPESPAGAAQVMPASMMQLGRAIEDGSLRIDGVLFSGRRKGDAQVAAGIAVDLIPVAFKRARFRAVEINDALPAVPSRPLLPLDQCDLVASSRHEPPELSHRPPDDVARRIGAFVCELVTSGAVLELGLGSTLSGVSDGLVDAGLKISVHSGLISDGTQQLVEKGVAARALPCADGLPVVGAVAMGSEAFYRWLDDNRHLRLVDSRHAHDIAHLASLGNFVAVNAASRVDCTGQVGVPATATFTRGVGGLLDFAVAGAYGGASVVALRSVDRQGRSRIVPSLSAVQLPSTLVTHVVTEHGVAGLRNRTWHERHRALVGIAHPDHRAALRSARI